MGSGETAPTMVKVHRMMLERLGPPPVPTVLLDTPFGFQENAKELAQRAVHYFGQSLRTRIEVASTPTSALAAEGGGPTGDEPFADERLVSSIRAARYVFAGPGSPTYALRRWRNTIVPSLLHEKLQHGGGISFASAAALTLGVRTIPVYEIYKVGEDPHWLDGLDLLADAGLSAAVVPHYNNAEGGTHDTRFCYLGERRLSALEEELPEGAFVLGIDEHTSLTFDLDAGLSTVGGNGAVTVRARGRSRTFPSGTELSIEEILATAGQLASGAAGPQLGATGATGRQLGAKGATGAAGSQLGATGATGAPIATNESAGQGAAYSGSPLTALVREQEVAFSAALTAQDLTAAVGAVLKLESQITEWANDIPAGDALDRARASLRSLVVELGRLGEKGARDPRELVGPFVEALLELRARARSGRRFDESDWIRDRLGELGVEVRDGSGGTEWLLGRQAGAER